MRGEGENGGGTMEVECLSDGRGAAGCLRMAVTVAVRGGGESIVGEPGGVASSGYGVGDCGAGKAVVFLSLGFV